jgi:hypothetical protein
MKTLKVMNRAAMQLIYLLNSRSRQKKLDLFWDLMRPSPESIVLNLGAAPPHRSRVLLGVDSPELVEQPEQDPRWRSLRVIGANINKQDIQEYCRLYAKAGFTGVVMNGCSLPFDDQSVDIVFSNAVIEHVTPEMQRIMASEIMRVGRSWFITTPNFWYPIELHNKLPFIHFLPTKARLFIQRTLRTWPEAEPLTLLSATNLAALFPGSQIRQMRVTFYPETLVAYGRSSCRPRTVE